MQREELAAELGVMVNLLDKKALTYLLTLARAAVKRSCQPLYRYGCQVDTMRVAQSHWMGAPPKKQVIMLETIKAVSDGHIPKI